MYVVTYVAFNRDSHACSLTLLAEGAVLVEVVEHGAGVELLHQLSLAAERFRGQHRLHSQRLRGHGRLQLITCSNTNNSIHCKIHLCRVQNVTRSTLILAASNHFVNIYPRYQKTVTIFVIPYLFKYVCLLMHSYTLLSRIIHVYSKNSK